MALFIKMFTASISVALLAWFNSLIARSINSRAVNFGSATACQFGFLVGFLRGFGLSSTSDFGTRNSAVMVRVNSWSSVLPSAGLDFMILFLHAALVFFVVWFYTVASFAFVAGSAITMNMRADPIQIDFLRVWRSAGHNLHIVS